MSTNGGGTPTGTVDFEDGGNTISGCGSVALSNGVATCSTSFPTQGTHSLTAVYNPSGSFGASNSGNPLYQYVKQHTTVKTAGQQYCNSGAISMNGSADGTSVYPSVINIGTDGDGSNPSQNKGISTVSVTLNTLNASANGGDGSGFIHGLLESPDGHTLEFMSGTGDDESQPTVTVTWADANPPPPNNSGSTLLLTASYSASSTDISDIFASAPGGAVPQTPTSFNEAEPAGGGNSKTFEQAFNGSVTNGDWKPFILDNSSNATLAGGWCLNVVEATGTPTTTSVSASPNPAVGVAANITATVVNVSTLAPVTEGTVSFTEDGNQVVGANPVPVLSNGTATISTSTLPEGDHVITAIYNDGGGSYNLSYGTITQRVDNATPAPTVSSSAGFTTYQYCNAGAIEIPNPANDPDSGAAYPNPSNIFVTGLPGVTQDLSVQLNGFDHYYPEMVESLLVGEGTNLDLLSGAG